MVQSLVRPPRQLDVEVVEPGGLGCSRSRWEVLGILVLESEEGRAKEFESEDEGLGSDFRDCREESVSS